MHTYKLLTTQSELDAILVPVLQKNGSEIPPPDCYAAAVEMDEDGSVVAYQMLQNALFLEGLWAKDGSAHLLTVYRMATKLAEQLGAKRVLTMTRADSTGERIGRIAKRLGFEKADWNVFRRKV